MSARHLGSRAAIAVLGALLAACAPPSTLRARGMADAQSTEAVLREALRPRRVALFVGIDRYDDPAFAPLQHARDDATALAQALRQPDAGFDEVVVLASETGTTRGEVLEALRHLSATLRRDDELVVFFAGHGTRAPVGGELHRFVLTTDARTSDLVGTAIDLEALLSFVLDLPPLRKGIVVDSCFDGGGRSVVRPGLDTGEPAPEPVDRRELRLGPGDAEMFATTPGRPSLESDSLGHGIYTWYLLEALGWGFQEADRDGDGLLTLWEAHDHARGAVIAHTKGQQVPEAIVRTVGEADVVLRGRPHERTLRDRALVYLYPENDHPLSGATVEIDGRTRGALPGTVPIDAGRHELALLAPDGRVLTSGWVQVGAGRAYRADTLAERVQGELGTVGTRAFAVAAPGFAALGDAGAGVEISVDARVAPREARGLVVGGRLGLGAGVGALEGFGPRSLLTTGVDVAWQGDHQHLRWRLGWGLSAWWLPPRATEVDAVLQDDPYASPARAGWILGAMGPRVELAWMLSPRWGLVVHGMAEGTALRLAADAPAAFVPIVGGGLGVRAGW
ncbi:MAG: caspase family protein [Alphaproteobacteria bacterium]|nr:caspase family protein [Alphaproteobacteria bacterium]